MREASTPGSVDFVRPPVIETTLGVHFKRIREVTTAHLGLFWEFLGREHWPRLRELPAIAPWIEDFGVSPTTPLQFSFEQMERPEIRLRLDTPGRDRVVQIQPNLLLTQWVRVGDAPYPKYEDATKPAFVGVFSKWCDFLARYELPEPEPVQWEITYINRIPSGELWRSPGDWPGLFNGVLVPPAVPSGVIESAVGEYHYRLSEDASRLHVNVRHAVRPSEPEHLDVVLTARGSIRRSSSEVGQRESARGAISAGLDIGHHAIVTGFRAITSDKAHRYWGLREASDD